MWETNSIWFDLFVFTGFMLLGHILMGHFEERTPRWRRLLKALVVIVGFTALSAWLGRPVAFGVLGVSMIPVLYVHAILLPKKGINGWTAEPRDKYYEFRGWDKDIFGTGKKGGPAQD